MKYFQQGLQRLKQRALEMGALAESMVADVSRALVTDDAVLVQQVRAREPLLDQFQVEIDRDAVRLITVYAPVARDLRFLLNIVRINSELERIGDQAFDNCDYLELLPTPRPQLDELSRIAEIVLGMVRDALQAFRDEDVRKARAVMQMDDRVDTLDAQLFRSLLEHPAAAAEGRVASMGLILVARSLERIADHATNICEEVFYLVEGTDIRHQNAEIAPVVKLPSSPSRQ